MSKIREALAALAEKLKLNTASLEKCQTRHKSFRLAGEREHDLQLAAEGKGQTLRAARFKRRATARHIKARYWLGRIKQQHARIDHLDKSIEDREAELADWMKTHGIRIDANKVTGGTARQRLRAALHRAMLNYQQGTQPGYYSMSGLARAYAFALIHYPAGHIWDCSTFADAIYYACGLKSPSGPGGFTIGGYTGTEMAHGKVTTSPKVGDLVIYLRYPGDTIGHHVEVVLDPEKETTVGHGSPPIDEGVFDLFGDGLYEIRTYL